MAKHKNEEAFYERLRDLAQTKKPSIKESRTLGTLIDVKHAADGVAYGIVKENHHYYIKKGGLKPNPDVADFAYIGGLSNITEHQYPSVAVADKHRNMVFQVINEAISLKPNKNGGKKKILTEDKAGEEIEMAASKVDDLEAATDAAEVPVDAGSAEMDAGLEAIDAPADGGEELPVDAVPAGDGGEELPVDAVPAGDGGGEEEVAVEDPESEATREIEKTLGKLTNTLRKTELTEPQVKSYVNSFLSAFKDDFPDIDIEDRKAMAEKITKVVPPEDIEDLGQNVEDSEETEINVSEPEEEIAEEQCSECGGFAQYAESRGYTAESIMECGDEEMTNLVSGYANANSEGQNDGDFKAVALFITPEIIEKLKGDYGHDEYADQLTPYTNELSESSEEDKIAQINELFGGLKNLGNAAKNAVGNKVNKIGQNIANKASQVKQAVGNAATQVKQTYHAGELPKEVKKLEGIAANLGQQIAALNDRMVKSGQEPINVSSILTTIKNQVGGGGTADLSKFTNEEGIPVDSTEVQPMMEEDSIEEDVTIKVGEKAGKKLSPDNIPVKELKEEVEEEDGEIDINSLDVDGGDEEESKEEPTIGAGFEPMGAAVVKPEGAETTTVEVTKDSVNVTMNESKVMSESERKLRKYIRNRLQENAGIKKPSLNESVKSESLKKLDRLIDKQFKLNESISLEKLDNVNEILGFSVREKFAKLDPNDQAGVEKVFDSAFHNILRNPRMSGIGRAAKVTPTNVKYDILSQYVEGNGGTLRVAPDGRSVIYAPESLKRKSLERPFAAGGTGGKMQLGGV